MPSNEIYTASIINYLQENSSMLENYFKECQENNSKPSYSSLLFTLEDTNQDNINLASSKVMRSIVTNWLIDEYVVWLVS